MAVCATTPRRVLGQVFFRRDRSGAGAYLPGGWRRHAGRGVTMYRGPARLAVESAGRRQAGAPACRARHRRVLCVLFGLLVSRLHNVR